MEKNPSNIKGVFLNFVTKCDKGSVGYFRSVMSHLDNSIFSTFGLKIASPALF